MAKPWPNGKVPWSRNLCLQACYIDMSRGRAKVLYSSKFIIEDMGTLPKSQIRLRECACMIVCVRIVLTQFDDISNLIIYGSFLKT